MKCWITNETHFIKERFRFLLNVNFTLIIRIIMKMEMAVMIKKNIQTKMKMELIDVIEETHEDQDNCVVSCKITHAALGFACFVSIFLIILEIFGSNSWTFWGVVNFVQL